MCVYGEWISRINMNYSIEKVELFFSLNHLFQAMLAALNERQKTNWIWQFANANLARIRRAFQYGGMNDTRLSHRLHTVCVDKPCTKFNINYDFTFKSALTCDKYRISAFVAMTRNIIATLIAICFVRFDSRVDEQIFDKHNCRKSI